LTNKTNRNKKAKVKQTSKQTSKQAASPSMELQGRKESALYRSCDWQAVPEEGK
jgi:hypothetical protein